MSDTEMNPAGSVIAWIKTNTSDSNYYDLYIGSELLIGGTDLSYFFYGLSNVEGIYFDNFDTRETTSMYVMFYGCESIVSLDVSGFNTVKVTDMSGMFQNCVKLTTLDVSKWNTSNVTTMHAMFCGGYDDENGVNNVMSVTTLNLSGWDTSKVTNTEAMFSNCAYLTTTLPIKNVGTTTYENMFLRAATESGAKITVNYTSATSSLVDSMIQTKSENSNVVKGSLVS